MSRGFHAFFRQYYNLRAVLRRTDPTLERLRPLDDYPLVRDGGGRDSFADIPRTPPWNLAAFVARSPSFDLNGPGRRRRRRRAGPARRRLPRDLRRARRASAPPTCSTGCASPRGPATSRSRCSPAASSPTRASSPAAELVAMFHMYFVGSAEGLLFDVPRDDYDATLWAPARRATWPASASTCAPGARCARSVEAGRHGLSVLHGLAGHDDQDWLAADAVVLALDPVGPAPRRRRLRRARRRRRGGCGVAGARGRHPVRAAFAVWRLWLSGRVAPERPPFLGTSGYGPLDNVSVLERFEDARGPLERRRTAARVVELHAYALPEGTDEADLRAVMLAELHRVYPETAGARRRARRVARRARLRRSSGWSPGGRAPASARRTRGSCSPATRCGATCRWR